MLVCLDTSVILRKLFGEPQPLQEWKSIRQAYASRLVPIEIGRVIDRARLQGELDDVQVEQLHQESRKVLRSTQVVALTEPILTHATRAIPTVLGTLDAIHLATALELARWLQASSSSRRTTCSSLEQRVRRA